MRRAALVVMMLLTTYGVGWTIQHFLDGRAETTTLIFAGFLIGKLAYDLWVWIGEDEARCRHDGEGEGNWCYQCWSPVE
jgi:hypothetical protein